MQSQVLLEEADFENSLDNSTINCEMACKASPSPMESWKGGKTLIIDDFEQSDRDLNKYVDCVKLHFKKFLGRNKALSAYENLQKAKTHILALVKGHRARKHFTKIKRAVKTIQMHFKGFLAKQKLKTKAEAKPEVKPEPEPVAQPEPEPALSEEDLKKQRQMEFIQKQREMVKMKKKRREAVLTIEKFFYKKIIRQKYRELRKKLAKIPKEMRIVYFKYMALRTDTNNLISEFNDAMPREIMSPTNFLIE